MSPLAEARQGGEGYRTSASTSTGEPPRRRTGSGPVAPDLQPVLDLAMAQARTGVLVGRSEVVLAERYAPGWGPDRPRGVASVARSILAVLIAMAVEDGAFTSLDQAGADFIPAWRDDPRAGITLGHLMRMTSGLDDTGLALRGVLGDQFATNAASPLRHPPGTHWAYNTAAYHLLFQMLKRATGQSIEAFARSRLFGPLGMDDTRWITSAESGAQGPRRRPAIWPGSERWSCAGEPGTAAGSSVRTASRPSWSPRRI